MTERHGAGCELCAREIRSKYLLYDDGSRVCAACALASGLAEPDIRPATSASGRHVARLRGRYLPPSVRAAALHALLGEPSKTEGQLTS